MRFLRAEEGDDETPAAIGPVMQIVPAPAPPTNGHKKTVAHAAPAHAAPAHAAPAPAPAPPAPAVPARTAPAHAASAAAPAAEAPVREAPAHAAPVHTAPVHKAPAHAAPAYAAPPKRQPRELNGARPAPRIRPEMLDACVVALRRMGGPGLRSVGVTSSVRGEGRSTVAAAMAVIYASEYRRRTLLIELDGRGSPAAREFGLEESPGVAELMRDNLRIDECIQWVTDDLGVVVAGADPSLATLLRGSAAEEVVSALSSRADMLVLDLPPLTNGAGGVQLVDLCESVALVVRAGVSTHQIEDAAAALTAPPFVIMNGVKSAAPRWVRRLLGMH